MTVATTTPLVASASKPQLVVNLRATWRASVEHAAEQLARFLRLFLLAAPVPIVDLIVKGGGHFDWETLLIAVVPIGETAWRQVFPALGAAKADSAPGVTIVPSQVDPDAAPETDLGMPQPDDGADPTPVGDVEEDAGTVDGGYTERVLATAVAAGVLLGLLVSVLIAAATHAF